MANKSEQARKNFAVIVSAVIVCLTMVSLVASYSVYLESFIDWSPGLARIFAILVTIGVEVAFGVLVYGMMKALLGGEIPIAGFGAAVLLVVMCVNFVVHSNVARHIPLEPWQVEYRNWVGLVVPFFTIALFIALSWVSPEAKERRQERRMAYVGKQRALDYTEEFLESPELEGYLETTRPQIAHGVRHQIVKGLPTTASASNERRIGFGTTADKPSEPRNEAMDYMRQRWFSGTKDQTKS
jgi:phage shock protein PspC (stress-responsive transcriptional regulator)